MNERSVVLGVAVGLLMISSTVFAHHGSARLKPNPANILYDGDTPVTMVGTVTEFLFINPHVLVVFEVRDANGKIVEWIAESAPPARLYRAGWKKDSLKLGDKVTVTGMPMENGAKFLVFEGLITPDGRTLGANDAGRE